MNKVNVKRDITIPIRVTQQEKDQISKNAKAYGGTISEFCRDVLQHPDGSFLNGAKLQTGVCELCRLSEDIRKISDHELQHNLQERIEKIWQFMKS